MNDYVDLLKSGSRSLNSEIQKILGLATIYGDSVVHDAVSELLQTATIGVDNLELLLKAQHNRDDTLHPAPLNFQNSKLNRVPPAVDLRRYDAFLFEASRSSQSITTEASNEVQNDNNPVSKKANNT